VYDTVTNASWSVDVRTHGIVTVIEKVLSEPWPPSAEIGREVPEPVTEDDCVVSYSSCVIRDVIVIYANQECFSWEFGDGM